MKKRLIKVFIKLIIISIIGITYIILKKKYNISIPCVFHKITNLYCPGCGATRCILSLLKGNVKEAISYNMLLFILLPFITFHIAYEIYLYIFNKKDKLINKIPKIVWLLLLIITITFGILRNIDTFNYLAP